VCRVHVVLMIGSVLLMGGTGHAQQAERSTWLQPPHLVGPPPDYLLGLVRPPLARIRMPEPPAERREPWHPHHAPRPPDYSETIRSNVTATIPIPPPPHGRPPAAVRGLYVNGWIFGSSRFYDLLALADSTEINALVIDVKDATGFLTYRSSVPTAEYIGANGVLRIADPRLRLAQLEARGIHAIARIVVARDPLLARRKPAWAIHDSAGGLWHDGLSEPWVDAYNDSVWIYAAEIAAEAVLMGFREIQFDYVRFPDEPPHRLDRTVYPARRPGESKRDAIRRNVELLQRRVAQMGVPFTLDVFGLTASARGDLGIGQVWEDLAASADVLLPMVYPSHYARGFFGIRNPNTEPYTVVRRALEDAIARSRGLARPARIRPYLQAFTIYRVRYSALEVRAQIQAVEDLGLTDWVLWNARGVYPPAALRPSARPPIRPSETATPDQGR